MLKLSMFFTISSWFSSLVSRRRERIAVILHVYKRRIWVWVCYVSSRVWKFNPIEQRHLLIHAAGNPTHVCINRSCHHCFAMVYFLCSVLPLHTFSRLCPACIPPHVCWRCWFQVSCYNFVFAYVAPPLVSSRGFWKIRHIFVGHFQLQREPVISLGRNETTRKVKRTGCARLGAVVLGAVVLLNVVFKGKDIRWRVSSACYTLEVSEVCIWFTSTHDDCVLYCVGW